MRIVNQSHMIVIHQKQEIVQSLDDLDAIQSEKVLDFIKELLDRQRNEADQQSLDRKALKEINRALRHPRLWM